MPTIELSAGTIDYEDTGGTGPTIVLLHGLMMDASLWEQSIAELSVDNRCVAPTLPARAHRHAMPDADLSLPGDSFGWSRSSSTDSICTTSSSSAMTRRGARATDHGRRRRPGGRVVLVSCDAFDNFPPGLTGRTLVRTGRLSPRLRNCSCSRCDFG